MTPKARYAMNCLARPDKNVEAEPPSEKPSGFPLTEPAARGEGSSKSSPTRQRRALLYGLLLYTITSAADAALTLKGMDGDLSLEGNGFMRGLMIRWGPLNALIALKVAVGLFGALVAAWGYPAIRRQERWTAYLALTPWTRRWMSSGDRSWIAFIPLYASAIVWGLAALGWAALFWLVDP